MLPYQRFVPEMTYPRPPIPPCTATLTPQNYPCPSPANYQEKSPASYFLPTHITPVGPPSIPYLANPSQYGYPFPSSFPSSLFPPQNVGVQVDRRPSYAGASVIGIDDSPQKNYGFLNQGPILNNNVYNVNYAQTPIPVAMATQKIIPAPKYTCETCGKSFQKSSNLRGHMRIHSAKRPYKCPICSKTFARSHDQKRHYLVHGGEKRFKCGGYLKNGKKWGCGRMFARSDALSRHLRTESGSLCVKALEDEAKEERARSELTKEHYVPNSKPFPQYLPFQNALH